MDISTIKAKHVLLAAVGVMFLGFYAGVVLSKRLYFFRMMLFVMVLFLMGLYCVHRFLGGNRGGGSKGEQKYAWHIGIGALLLFLFFVGVQTGYFLYYQIIGIGGLVLLLPAIRDVMATKK